MSANSSSAPRDLGPAVKFPPPLLFAVVFGLGALLERKVPLPVAMPSAMHERAWSMIGLAVIVAGFALVYTGIITFRRARTAVYPNRPARNLVTHGIYTRTRNPMYLGMTVAYLGGVLATAMLWPLVLLPIVIVGIRTQVIAREERHLRERFPAEYAEYSGRVRRWL